VGEGVGSGALEVVEHLEGLIGRHQVVHHPADRLDHRHRILRPVDVAAHDDPAAARGIRPPLPK